MRHIFITVVALLAAYGMARADKTIFDFQTSEARAIDVAPSTHIKPLVAEVVVDTRTGRISDTWQLSAAELFARMIEKDDPATIRNLKAYALFKSSQKHNCDLIVAPTFDVRITNEGAWISVVGYPANFANWSSVNTTDYEWIGKEAQQKASSNSETDEKSKK